MKILVAIKRVIDFNVRIRVKLDETGIETSNVKMAMNPFDEIAVEEALRIQEALKKLNPSSLEVVVVSIGKEPCQETLRTALAMGANRAIRVDAPTDIQPLEVAKILHALAKKEAPDLIIAGKQAIDTDDNQVGQMLAGLLNWPQGTFVSHVLPELEENTVRSIHITREIDGGLETLRLTLPAVITTDLRLNTPRYLSLPNIIQAKRKPLDILSLSDLNLDLTIELKPHFNVLKITAPKKREKGIKVNSAAELIEKLKHEARVI